MWTLKVSWHFSNIRPSASVSWQHSSLGNYMVLIYIPPAVSSGYGILHFLPQTDAVCCNTDSMLHPRGSCISVVSEVIPVYYVQSGSILRPFRVKDAAKSQTVISINRFSQVLHGHSITTGPNLPFKMHTEANESQMHVCD